MGLTMPQSHDVPCQELYANGGQAGAMFRKMDWSTTLLGPAMQWPRALCTAVSITLNARHPALVAWGPDLAVLFNDGCLPLLGEQKALRLFGHPLREVWEEAWPTLRPLFSDVLENGRASFRENLPLEVTRAGHIEDVTINLSLGPLREDRHTVSGVFAVWDDTTASVLLGRRHEVLRDITVRMGRVRTAQEAVEAASAALAATPRDVPFSLLYLQEGECLRLAAQSGLRATPSPDVEQALADACELDKSLKLRKPIMLKELSCLSDHLQSALITEPPRQALALPLISQPRGDVLGAIVLGANPRLSLDRAYRDFFEMTSAYIATGIAHGRMLERTLRDLRESEHRFREVLDCSSALIYLKDRQGHFTLVNRTFEHIFNVSRNSIEGRPSPEGLPEAPPSLTTRDRLVLETGKSIQFEESARLHDGIHTFMSLKFPLRDSSGAIYGLGGISTDITEQKQADAELQRSRDEFQFILDAAPVAIAYIDAAQRHRFINMTYARMALRDCADILGKTIREVHGEDAWNCFRPTFEMCLSGRETAHEASLSTPDGSVRHMAFSLAPHVEADGTVSGVVVAATDITARKQAEESLQRTAQELATSNRELEQFASTASHDLQEPLLVIGGYLDLLKSEYGDRLPEEADKYVTVAVDSVERMTTLIKDMLAYARLQRRGRAFEPMDSTLALDKAIASLEVSIRQSDAKITRGPMPTVNGDLTQITQLFQNLLGNALKFHGQRTPEISIGARREEDAWLFWVRDNGIGIEPRYREQIFDMFTRLHGRDEYPGTGIGLSICKKIVERHGGRIWVESQPGRGATFFFTLRAHMHACGA